MDVEMIIKRFLTEELLRGGSQGPFDPDGSLISTGILDSLSLLKLLLFIEERFGLKVEDGEVIPKNFETVKSIKAFIEGKQKVAAG